MTDIHRLTRRNSTAYAYAVAALTQLGVASELFRDVSFRNGTPHAEGDEVGVTVLFGLHDRLLPDFTLVEVIMLAVDADRKIFAGKDTAYAFFELVDMQVEVRGGERIGFVLKDAENDPFTLMKMQ